jgi:1-acyl-sn-glycerol-3-phosphate acyltransferase
MITRFIEWLLIALVRPLVRARTKCQSRALSSGPCIYVANHSSHLDAVLLIAALPAPLRHRTRPVAAAEYWTADPLRRYLIHSIFRGVLVGRERTQLNPLEPAAQALRQGDSLIFFPEGTRGSGGLLQALKPGIFHLARWFPSVDIVPVWIDNSYRVLPKGFTIPLPVRCSITFGTPLRWKDQRQDDFLSEVRHAIEMLRPGEP